MVENFKNLNRPLPLIFIFKLKTDILNVRYNNILLSETRFDVQIVEACTKLTNLVFIDRRQ